MIKLEIITPDGMIFDDEVKLVTVPGSEGEFGVLAGHAAVLSFLTTGVVSIEDKNGIEIQVAINGGYVHVVEEKVLCMVDGAVSLCGGDTDLAMKIAKARTLLEKAHASTLTVISAINKFDKIKKY